MKTNKLMLTIACCATLAAACQKENVPVQEEQIGNKSIVMSIANVQTPTKSAGTQTTDQTQVTLNNYQVFFADDAGAFYTPKDATAEAEAATYFEVNATDGTNQNFDHQFHFLDNNVTRVIVVGNKGADFNPANEAELWNALANVAIADQQNKDALILYGSDSDLVTTENHYVTEDAADPTTGTDQHPSPVYKAVVNLMPAVARFEIVGYEYAQKTVAEGETAPAREYALVVMNNQSLINFYDAASFTSEGETDWTVTPGKMSKQYIQYSWNDVYQEYFTKLTDDDKKEWYYDATAYTLDDTNGYKANVVPAEGMNCYAYHVYPTAVPSFIFQITATDADGIVTPMYLQTKKLTGCDATKAGVVYQMVVKFDDSVLKAAEKCIDVEIFVHDWHVVVVTPEF